MVVAALRPDARQGHRLGADPRRRPIRRLVRGARRRPAPRRGHEPRPARRRPRGTRRSSPAHRHRLPRRAPAAPTAIRGDVDARRCSRGRSRRAGRRRAARDRAAPAPVGLAQQPAPSPGRSSSALGERRSRVTYRLGAAAATSPSTATPIDVDASSRPTPDEVVLDDRRACAAASTSPRTATGARRQPPSVHHVLACSPASPSPATTLAAGLARRADAGQRGAGGGRARRRRSRPAQLLVVLEAMKMEHPVARARRRHRRRGRTSPPASRSTAARSCSQMEDDVRDRRTGPCPHRQLLGLLRRPALGGSGDGRGRADRRAHRRLPRRADDAHPVEGQGRATRRRLRHDVPTPDRGGARHLHRPGHPGRHQRRRPQPGGLRRRGARHRRPSSASPSHVAHIEGDDLLDRDRRPAARTSPTSTPAQPLHGAEPVTANAYLGGWGIAAALAAGADVVVCPRVTDAALVVGPAAWWYGWAPTTGTGSPAPSSPATSSSAAPRPPAATTPSSPRCPTSPHPGFPIAEVDADGSSVITKHPGTGGRRHGRHRHRPAALRDRRARLRQPRRRRPLRHDPPRRRRARPGAHQRRARRAGAGRRPRSRINHIGGFRNTVTFVLTGLDLEAKAELAERRAVRRPRRRRATGDAGITMSTRFVPAPSDGADQERSSGAAHGAR